MTLAGPAIEKENFRVNDYQLTDKEVESEDLFHIILLFPLIGDNQKHSLGMVDNAVKKICAEKKFAFMTNVRIYSSGWYIPYIYGQYKFVIRGEGWTEGQRSELMNGLKDAGFEVSLGHN
jgi:hypothetical protein